MDRTARTTWMTWGLGSAAASVVAVPLAVHLRALEGPLWLPFVPLGAALGLVQALLLPFVWHRRALWGAVTAAGVPLGVVLMETVTVSQELILLGILAFAITPAALQAAIAPGSVGRRFAWGGLAMGAMYAFTGALLVVTAGLNITGPSDPSLLSGAAVAGLLHGAITGWARLTLFKTALAQPVPAADAAAKTVET